MNYKYFRFIESKQLGREEKRSLDKVRVVKVVAGVNELVSL